MMTRRDGFRKLQQRYSGEKLFLSSDAFEEAVIRGLTDKADGMQDLFCFSVQNQPEDMRELSVAALMWARYVERPVGT